MGRFYFDVGNYLKLVRLARREPDRARRRRLYRIFLLVVPAMATLHAICFALDPVDAVRDHLPAGTRTVTPDERREQVRVRQEHVQRRYRQS